MGFIRASATMIVRKGRLFFGQISSCLRLSRPFEEKKGPGNDQKRQRQVDAVKSYLKDLTSSAILPELLQSLSYLLSFLAAALAQKYVLTAPSPPIFLCHIFVKQAQRHTCF